MIKNGFALVHTKDGAVVAQWSAIPSRIDLPSGDAIFNAKVGDTNGAWRVEAKAWEEPDPPPPPPRMAEKATILERLTDAQIAAALSAMTPRQKERWRMPGYPDIRVDDPELLALLRAVGADPAKVLA